MKKISLIILLSIVSSCSFDVKKAVAPSDPPQVEKSVFSASQIRGHFSTDGSPKMFMWPIYKNDQNGDGLVPMSFAEKVETRQVITAYNEDLELYTQKFTTLEEELNGKYNKLLKDLENEFTQKSCYSYCDPESILCDPTNETELKVDDWIVGETPEEEALIASCQENQSQRENIGDEKDQEIAEKVEPLRKKAAEAALAIFQTVGDRNYFKEITSFELFYGQFECRLNQGCEKNEKLADDRSFAQLEFGATVLNNFEANQQSLQIENLILDASGGFLQFSTPAIDFENGNEIYGEIFYDLEFIETEQGVLRLDGDIRVTDFSTGEERIGRFSSSGKINQQ